MNCMRLLLCLTFCLLCACVSETQRVEDPIPRTNNPLPQEVLRVPQQLQDVSGDLLRYHAKHQVLPATLEQLVEKGFISPEQYADLPDYVYHPQGLGVLNDGRMVILVDAKVRIEGHAWCIVRAANGGPRTIQFNVTPIALNELEAAVRQQ
ncbi:MAG: hypothetical protein AB8C95_15615 [Phycisphaeraceae bacterium]